MLMPMAHNTQVLAMAIPHKSQYWCLKHTICLVSSWALIPTATNTGSIPADTILIFLSESQRSNSGTSMNLNFNKLTPTLWLRPPVITCDGYGVDAGWQIQHHTIPTSPAWQNMWFTCTHATPYI